LYVQLPVPIAESSRLSLLTRVPDSSLPTLTSSTEKTPTTGNPAAEEGATSVPECVDVSPTAAADSVEAIPSVDNWTAASDVTQEPSQLPAQHATPLPNARFLELSCALKAILQCHEPVASIPRGTKENVYVVIQNERNLLRRQQGKRSEFVDDCGVWDSASGAAPKFTYIADMNLGFSGLTKVYLRDGKYCTQSVINRKTTYVPVEPQPPEESILEVHRIYSALKRDHEYKRRVTYVTKMPPYISATVPALALVEYMGQYPGGAPHGNNKYSARPYVQVLEEIAVAVQDTAPRAVFKRMERLNAEHCAPRNLRQVQSIKSKQRQKACQEDDGPLTVGNLAQQIQHVESMVHQHPSVQATWHGKGVSPSVILHTDEQLLDVKRFCCSAPAGQTTVLASDKTFNLTEVHVTMAVYKNLALCREGTHKHPIMTGPIFVHGTSDYDTYSVFFDYLKRKLRQCSSQPVLGSDDEKAMRKAMKDAFPYAGSLVCERHFKKM